MWHSIKSYLDWQIFLLNTKVTFTKYQWILFKVVIYRLYTSDTILAFIYISTVMRTS